LEEVEEVEETFRWLPLKMTAKGTLIKKADKE
jgi:hypothetical protein